MAVKTLASQLRKQWAAKAKLRYLNGQKPSAAAIKSYVLRNFPSQVAEATKYQNAQPVSFSKDKSGNFQPNFDIQPNKGFDIFAGKDAWVGEGLFSRPNDTVQKLPGNMGTLHIGRDSASPHGVRLVIAAVPKGLRTTPKGVINSAKLLKSWNTSVKAGVAKLKRKA